MNGQGPGLEAYQSKAVRDRFSRCSFWRDRAQSGIVKLFGLGPRLLGGVREITLGHDDR